MSGRDSMNNGSDTAKYYNDKGAHDEFQKTPRQVADQSTRAKGESMSKSNPVREGGPHGLFRN